MIATPVIKSFSLLLLVLSALPYSEAGHIFDITVPTACVTDYLGPAGFCALQMGCKERCFKDEPVVPSRNIDSDLLNNFFIPVNATECYQLEEPICPATDCCPECKEELEDLFRCLINEGGHHYIYYLAGSCPMDCTAPTTRPARFPTPLPTPGPTPGPTLEPNQNPTPSPTPRATPGLRTGSPTIAPNLSTSGSDTGLDPITDVDFDSNSTLSNLTASNITTCTVTNCTTDFEIGLVCNTFIVNCTSNANGTAINGTADNSTSNINGIPDNSPIREPITIVSTTDSVTMIDGHHNTTTVLDGDPTGPVDNTGPGDNGTSNNNEPVDDGLVENNVSGDNGTNSSIPDIAPIREPITIVSTTDSVTIIDNHHNTTTVLDGDPTANPPVEIGTATTTATNEEPQDNEEEVQGQASTSTESTTEVQVIEADIEKDVILIVSNPDSVVIIDSHHNTTTVVSTRPP